MQQLKYVQVIVEGNFTVDGKLLDCGRKSGRYPGRMVQKQHCRKGRACMKGRGHAINRGCAGNYKHLIYL